MKLSTRDYLFLTFKNPIVPLMEICKIYYPHLKSKRTINQKVQEMYFPFVCFKVDNSTNAPYFVNIEDVATAIDKLYLAHAKEYANFHR